MRVIGRKKAGKSRGFPTLWMEIIKDIKTEQRHVKTNRDKNVKIHTRRKEVLQHRIGDFVWTDVSARGDAGGSRKKLIQDERRK